MQKVNLFLNDSSEAIATGIVGGIGTKLLWSPQVINSRLPILNLLNGYDEAFLYAILFGGSNALQSYTGDFIAPLVTNSQVFSQINKLTRPMSTGAIAVGLMFILNGFSISMIGALQSFALGSVSNIVGQWSAQMIFPRRNDLLLRSQQISAPQMSITRVPEYVDRSNPFDGIGLFGTDGGFMF
jgi:hypothetical protein